MGAAIKCDRCCKFEDVKVNQSEVDLQRISKVDADDNGKTLSTTTYELCTGCTAALRKWLVSNHEERSSR